MALFSILANGTRVIASADFGPIIKGQAGIIIARQRSRWRVWRRSAYVCTFLGGATVTATRQRIVPHDHGCPLEMLRDPFWFLETRAQSATRGHDAAEPTRSVPRAEWRADRDV